MNARNALVGATDTFHHAIRTSPLDIEAIAEITGLSKAKIRSIRSTSTLNAEAITEMIELLPEGQFTTYGALAEALGSPHGAQAVGQIIGTKDVGLDLAVRVIGTNRTSGLNFAAADQIKSHHTETGKASRHDVLLTQNTKVARRGTDILVPMADVVDADGLRRLYAADALSDEAPF